MSDDDGYLMAGYTGPDNIDLSGLLIRTDSLGNVIWENSYRNSASIYSNFWNVLATDDGGYLASGNELMPDSTWENAWLVKVGDDGEIEWQNTIVCVEEDSFIYGSLATSDGGYIHTGGIGIYTQNTLDLLLVKTDANGDVDWLNRYRVNGNDSGYDICETEAGEFVVAGKTRIDPNTLGYLMMVDSTGTVQWDLTYSDGSFVRFERVEVLEEGSILIGGYSTESGMILAEYDEFGELQWEKDYGQDTFFGDFQVCSNGDVVCTGRAEDPGVMLMRCDPFGNVIWQTSINGGEGSESGRALVENPDGGYTVASGVNDYPVMDIWLLKFESCTGIEEGPEAEQGFSAFTEPNPFDEHITVSYHLDAPADMLISVYDCSGRQIEEFQLKGVPRGNGSFQWSPGPETPAGCYSIVLDAVNEVIVCRCIKLE